MPYTYQSSVQAEPRSIYDIPSTSEDVWGTNYEQALEDNPLSAVSRMTELNLALDPDMARTSLKKPILSKSDADKRLQEYGLGGQIKVDETGITETGLSELMRRKEMENKRNEVRQRAAGGFSENVGSLGVGLWAMLHDPTNIALGFVPIVGEARYAAALARTSGVVGRTAVRAGVGFAEGAVGQALVEPLTLASRNYEQADYTIGDSLLNTLVGGVFGSTLHMGAGGVAEVGRSIRAADPFSRGLESLPSGDATLVRNMRQEIADGLDAATIRTALDTWTPEQRAAIEVDLPISMRSTPTPPRMEDLGQETRDAIIQTGIGQVIHDQPIDIEGIFRTEIGRMPDGRSTLDLTPERFNAATMVDRADELRTSIDRQSANAAPVTVREAVRDPGGRRAETKAAQLTEQRTAVEAMARGEPLSARQTEAIRQAVVQLATDQGVVVPHLALDGASQTTVQRATAIRQAEAVRAFNERATVTQEAQWSTPDEMRMSDEQTERVLASEVTRAADDTDESYALKVATEEESLANAELRSLADRLGADLADADSKELDEQIAKSERWARTAELATVCLTRGIT